MATLLPPSFSMLQLQCSQQHATEHSHLLLRHVPSYDSDTMSEATCSVIRRVPWTDPGGCDWIARYMGPPPRPTVPPRPWNSVSLTSNSLHTYACIPKQSATDEHSLQPACSAIQEYASSCTSFNLTVSAPALQGTWCVWSRPVLKVRWCLSNHTHVFMLLINRCFCLAVLSDRIRDNWKPVQPILCRLHNRSTSQSNHTIGAHKSVTVLDAHHIDTTLSWHDSITILDVHHADTTLGDNTLCVHHTDTVQRPGSKFAAGQGDSTNLD